MFELIVSNLVLPGVIANTSIWMIGTSILAVILEVHTPTMYM